MHSLPHRLIQNAAFAALLANVTIANAQFPDADAPVGVDASQAYDKDENWTAPAPRPISALAVPSNTVGSDRPIMKALSLDDGLALSPGTDRSEARYANGNKFFAGRLRAVQWASKSGNTVGLSKIQHSVGVTTLGKLRNLVNAVISSRAEKGSDAVTRAEITYLGKIYTANIQSDTEWTSELLLPKAQRTWDAGSWTINPDDFLPFSTPFGPFDLKTKIIATAPVISVKATPHRAGGGVHLDVDTDVAVKLVAETNTYRVSSGSWSLELTPKLTVTVISSGVGSTTDTEIQETRPGIRRGMVVKHLTSASAESGNGSLRVRGHVEGSLLGIPFGFDFDEELLEFAAETLSARVLLQHADKIFF